MADRKTAADVLDEGAKTYRERNAIYGDNYLKVGAVMEALFPEGVFIKTADDWNRLHIFILGIVKQTRYIENWHKGGHADSTLDNTVYSAMLHQIDEDIRNKVLKPAAREAKAFPPPQVLSTTNEKPSAPRWKRETMDPDCNVHEKCDWRIWPESDGNEEVCVNCQRLRPREA